MSKVLQMGAEIAVNEDTGKRRILTHIYKDEVLDVTFILTANEAEQWGAKLMYLAEETRKKNPTPEKFFQRLSNWRRRLWFTKK